MEINHCRRCGTDLEQLEHHAFRCANKHMYFANAAPSTGIFIVDDEQNVTLSVRGIEPHKGMLDAFGGFIDGAELAEDALIRELKEELDLDEDDYTTPVFLCTGVGQYPFLGETLPVLSLLYYIKLKPGVTLTPQDDVADVATFALNDIPFDRLHAGDIVRGVEVLQQRLAR